MCEFCDASKVILKDEVVSPGLVAMCGKTPANKLIDCSDWICVFIDRGYIRLSYLDDGDCLDHGEKIEISYCPFCGAHLKR